jgi:hypothetical protein
MNFCLCKVNQFGNPLQVAIIVAKYAPCFSYTSKMLHLEGEKVFGSQKQHANFPPRPKGDSQRYDHVNFSHPRTYVTFFISTLVHMYLAINPLLMQDVTLLLQCTILVKYMKMFVIMVFGVFNNVPPCSTLNVVLCKIIINITT